MKTLLNVDTITSPDDFREFAAEIIDQLSYEVEGDDSKLDQFEPVLAALCYAFHVDLLRGEALECYDPDLFWTVQTATDWADRTDEDGNDPESLGRSAVGAGIGAILDHIFETWM